MGHGPWRCRGWTSSCAAFLRFPLPNAFVVAAYVIASCFAYAYAFVLTRRPLAAAAAGLIYGLGDSPDISAFQSFAKAWGKTSIGRR